MNKKADYIIGVLVGLVLLGLGIWLSVRYEAAGRGIELFILIALAVITAVYAYSTNGIAKSAKTQADVAERLLDETKEQRLDRLDPVMWVDYLEEYDSASRTMNRFFQAQNIGLGPAVNIDYELAYKTSTFAVIARKSAMKADGERDFVITSVPKYSSHPSVEFNFVIDWQDIYGRYQFKLERPFKWKQKSSTIIGGQPDWYPEPNGSPTYNRREVSPKATGSGLARESGGTS
ncbi:MAG: hypothetical protein O2854_06580 [Chloroflexi bacterium]|nr:hypothetical protein [Chloroflexota bacterium]